jgi:hypothetical protein
MYYEEQVIDGVLCSRSDPNAKFAPMSVFVLTGKVIALRLFAARVAEHFEGTDAPLGDMARRLMA